MANELVKVIEGDNGADVQNKVNAWIATLTAGYVLNEMAVSQFEGSRALNTVVLAIKYVDGT